MRIAVVSDYFDNGGAGIACSRLVKGMASAGHRVDHFAPSSQAANCVPYHSDETPEYRRILVSGGLNFRGASRFLRTVPPDWRKRIECGLWSRSLAELIKDRIDDVIWMHNIHQSPWSLSTVLALRRLAPVVCTMHDCWFSHGYAYEYPALRGRKRIVIDPSCGASWQREKLFRKDSGVLWVTPSEWLRGEVLLKFPSANVQCIPNGIDPANYRIVDRGIARQALGIPVDRRVIALSSVDLSDDRKGVDIVIEALNRSRECSDVLLLGLGGGTTPSELASRYFSFGYVKNTELQSLIYSAADALVIPSRVDNLPNVGIEALFCGVPIIASNSGGQRELASHGCGVVFPIESQPVNLPLLLQQAKKLGEDRSVLRERAIKKYSLQQAVMRYSAAFTSTKLRQNS